MASRRDRRMPASVRSGGSPDAETRRKQAHRRFGRMRKTAAEVEHADKRRGLYQLFFAFALILAIAVLVICGMHIDEHVAKRNAAGSSEESAVGSTEQASNGFDKLTAAGGYYNNPQTGLKETWYSQNVLPGGGLEIEGRYVDESGLVRDGAGYIVCASSDFEKGTIVPTSLGMAKVYDTGCPEGVVDIYTAW